MRVFLVVLAGFFIAALPASGQQNLPDAPSVRDWRKVEALTPSRTVSVDSKGSHSSCIVQHTDADSLACTGATSFQRANVRSVRIHHRWRSAAVAGGIGFGLGAVIGAASGRSCAPNTFCLNFVSRGELATGFGAALGVVGLPVGYFTDFTGTTVYKGR